MSVAIAILFYLYNLLSIKLITFEPDKIDTAFNNFIFIVSTIPTDSVPARITMTINQSFHKFAAGIIDF